MFFFFWALLIFFISLLWIGLSIFIRRKIPIFIYSKNLVPCFQKNKFILSLFLNFILLFYIKPQIGYEVINGKFIVLMILLVLMDIDIIIQFIPFELLLIYGTVIFINKEFPMIICFISALLSFFLLMLQNFLSDFLYGEKVITDADIVFGSISGFYFGVERMLLLIPLFFILSGVTMLIIKKIKKKDTIVTIPMIPLFGISLSLSFMVNPEFLNILTT